MVLLGTATGDVIIYSPEENVFPAKVNGVAKEDIGLIQFTPDAILVADKSGGLV